MKMMQEDIIHLTDADYSNIAELLEAEQSKAVDNHTWRYENVPFTIDYQLDEATLILIGTINIRRESSGGNGYDTPKETITKASITLNLYDCRNENGESIKCDFEPKRLDLSEREL